tara:strand:+ start:2051 stop:2887 length:837 start_codon:yes stop_codon:yes gene_type:complete
MDKKKNLIFLLSIFNNIIITKFPGMLTDEQKLYDKLIEEFSLSSLQHWNIDTIEKIHNNITCISKSRNEGNYVEPITFTSSSGSVLVIIFPKFVLKIFTSIDVLKKVTKLINSGTNSENMINLYDSVEKDDFYAIITNVLKPLIDWNGAGPRINYYLSNEDVIITLLLQIGNALDSLHINGYNHGDCTLDNIGVYNNKFMLFDFNSGSLNGLPYFDIRSLFKSIISKAELNESSSFIISYLKDKSITNGNELTTNVIEYCNLYNKDIENLRLLVPKLK